MELPILLLFSKKISKKYTNFNNINDIYIDLISSHVVGELLKLDKINADDLIKLTFLIYLQKEGMSSDIIIKYISTNLIGFKISLINEKDPEIDCPNCGGDVIVGCDCCNDTGQEDCSTCDGSGQETCNYCGGDGTIGVEDDDCGICGGDGEVECEDCGGDGMYECNCCEGSGYVDCERCDGDGIIIEEGSDDVTTNNYITISPRIRNLILETEEDEPIRQYLIDEITNDKLTILTSIDDKVIDGVYDISEVGDYFLTSVNQKPNFSLRGNRVRF